MHTCFYAEGNKERDDWKSSHSLSPPLCFLNLVKNFQEIEWVGGGDGGKRGALDMLALNILRGGLLAKREVTFFKGVTIFLPKKLTN